MKDPVAATLPSAPTDTSVATDKITAATTASSNDSMRAIGDSPSMDDTSLGKDERRGLRGASSSSSNRDNIPDIPEYTPPLRLNAANASARLSGGSSKLTIPASVQSQIRARRKSESGGIRSGSRSPISTSRHNSNYDGGSSISSLEDNIDPDILTDKMGILELEPKQQQEAAQNLNSSFSNLPPVTERMSEETLEDVHAFSDVKSGHGGSVSRGNSITTGGEVSSNVLEPLEEVEDEDENENETGRVILTNMEEILEADEEEHHESPTLMTS